MRLLCVALLTLLGHCKLINCATKYELEAKNFIELASSRYFKIYDQVVAVTYASHNSSDYEGLYMTMETVQNNLNELVEISKKAKEYDLAKIQEPELKKALQNLRQVGELFVLGEEYYTSVLNSFTALNMLAFDKDNEAYKGGINIPNYKGEPLAYIPDIQRIFETSNDSEELKFYWESWRRKNQLWSLINFRAIIEAIKKAAKILDIPVLDFWYRHYDNKNFLEEMEKVMNEILPAYQQIHAFIRHELHKKYGNEVIEPTGPIPDHLFEQVLSQVWQPNSIIEHYFPYNELPPYYDFVKDFTARQLIDEAARFYTSLGFEPLDETFKQQKLKAQEEEANTVDCRADIFDLTPNVHMKFCSKVNFRKFMQDHGYLSRVYYAREKQKLPAYNFNSYNLEYPVGEAIILSASTPKHLTGTGLIKDFKFEEKTLRNRLMRMGLHTILNIPLYFIYTKVINDLLSGEVDMDSVNKHYWQLMEKYAGIEPPSDRLDGAFDFPYKFYIEVEQNYQTKKFVSEILGYQFYRAFCQKTEDIRPLNNCDFYGSYAIGNDLKQMMSLGSSRPWREVISKVLPKNPELSGDALLEYYDPILEWIRLQNVDSKVKIGWNSINKKVV